MSLQALVDAIRHSLEQDERWSITTDELISLLGVDTAEFYRTIYGIRDKIHLYDAIDVFTADNVGDLVTILECFHGPAAEAALSGAGVFLPHESRVELTECFLATVQQAVRRHKVRYQDFEGMLSAVGDFGRAFRIYIEQAFSIQRLFAQAHERFFAGRKPDVFACRLSSNYLANLFERHVLSFEGVFCKLTHVLERHAYECGFFSERVCFEDEELDDRHQRRKDIDHAKAVMEMDGARMTLELLKRQYKRLMKRYHPDLNPKGLERCKDINNAYALLVALEAG